MANFSGKWVFDHGENMEALVEKLQVDPAKIPKDRSTTVEIEQDGDNFHIVGTAASGKKRDVRFSIGQSFVDQDILELKGQEITVVPSWEGKKLVMTGKAGNKATREMVGSQMVITLVFGGVEGKRFFNRA